MAGRTPKTKANRISVTIDTADRAFLTQLASDQDRSLSWIAARAIHLFVAEARKSPHAVSDSTGEMKEA
jgi:predicted transcriptional regulator